VAQLQAREAALVKELDQAKAHIHQLEEKLAEVCMAVVWRLSVERVVQGMLGQCRTPELVNL
jgi:hypothetical protein